MISKKEEYTLQVCQHSNGDVVCVHDPKSLSNELAHLLNRLMTDANIKHENSLVDNDTVTLLKITIETVDVDIVIVPPVFISTQISA